MSPLLTVAGLVAAMTAPEPVRLVAESVAQGVKIQVVGAAGVDAAAAFTLEVDGDGNRSVHHGSARLAREGEPVVLSSVTIGLTPGRPWRAQLRVQPETGLAYEQSLSSR